MFEKLPPAAQDPLMHALEIVQSDPSPDKVDLSVGVYKDGDGRSTILDSVKRAEAWLLAAQDDKSYLSSAGNPDFIAEVRRLLLGGDAGWADRSAIVQTVGGSGALRIAGELVRQCNPAATVWIPDPSWANHHPIMQAAGLATRTYPYYDLTANSLDFATLTEALRGTAAGDVVILHGCCHNPSGADLTGAQWEAIADILAETGAVPLVDLAYQGFARGVEEDAAGVRLLARHLPELLVATSFSKNFGLYRDRVGAAALIVRDSDTITPWRHMLRIVRTSYSMPPDHGAAVVAHILADPVLRAEWTEELAAMRTRIQAMRARLADLLGANRYGYIAGQNGMFSFLDLTPEQVATLREQDHIYAVSTGRINLAGLTADNIDRVAAAIRRVSEDR